VSHSFNALYNQHAPVIF